MGTVPIKRPKVDLRDRSPDPNSSGRQFYLAGNYSKLSEVYIRVKDRDAALHCRNPRLTNLFNPLFEGSLPGATGLVVVGGRIDQEHAAGSPDRYIPVAAHLSNELALPDRLQSFRRRASFVETQIGDDLPQLAVLILQLLQPPHLSRQQTVIPLLPI